jgi:hypothetical protein
VGDIDTKLAQLRAERMNEMLQRAAKGEEK